MQSLPSFPCTLRNLLVPTQLLIGFDREVNCWSFRSPESAALPRRPGLPSREGGGGGPLRQHPRRARQVRGQGGEAASQAGWVNIALLTEVNSREGERGYKVEAMKQQIRYFGNKMLVVFYVLLRLVIQWHHLRSEIQNWNHRNLNTWESKPFMKRVPSAVVLICHNPKCFKQQIHLHSANRRTPFASSPLDTIFDTETNSECWDLPNQLLSAECKLSWWPDK